MKTPIKSKQQGFSQLAQPQAASKKPMRALPSSNQPIDKLYMEEQVESPAPAVAAPSLSLEKNNSSADSFSSGRGKIHAEKEAVITERKTTLMQGLVKKERAKRVRSEKDWLNDINKLIANNKLEAARAELKLFKKTYPDYTIDPKLSDLLKQQ